MTNGKHLKYMLLVGGGLFAVLLVAGVPLSTALSYAVLLACPLMMVGMMFMMGHGNGSSGHAGCGHDHGTAADQSGLRAEERPAAPSPELPR